MRRQGRCSGNCYLGSNSLHTTLERGSCSSNFGVVYLPVEQLHNNHKRVTFCGLAPILMNNVELWLCITKCASGTNCSCTQNSMLNVQRRVRVLANLIAGNQSTASEHSASMQDMYVVHYTWPSSASW